MIWIQEDHHRPVFKSGYAVSRDEASIWTVRLDRLAEKGEISLPAAKLLVSSNSGGVGAMLHCAVAADTRAGEHPDRILRRVEFAKLLLEVGVPVEELGVFAESKPS